MKASTQLRLLIVALLASLFLASCSSSSSGSAPPPPALYTIGGTVTNLASGDSVQLQDNGGNTLNVIANGTFTFSTSLASGTSYNVTVSAQPSSPAQTCGVTNGSGVATSNVTSVAVDCGHNEWTWMGGSSGINQLGTYGTQGTPAAVNVPGARWGAASWTDAAGNFWLFAGSGYALAGATGDLNDLWEYSGGQWTWMSGPDVTNQQGTYGTQGTAAAGNLPGGHYRAATWTDASGDFWLFGGNGYDSAGTDGTLNDLWKYSVGQWTWMSGSNIANQAGKYGTQGQPAADNVPGARISAVAWTDTAENLWLFGGTGYDSEGKIADLNDLWKYSGGQWTWMSGSNVGSQIGTYGTQGTAAPGNIPGARTNDVAWTDATGNFWLFGGYGYDSAGTQGYLNDLWKYSAGQWTWMGGANIANQVGTYGTQGTAAPGNVPGPRTNDVAWTDASGNFWLFGGTGYDSAGNTGDLNDLWKYSGGQWTWMSGSNIASRVGTYGTQGTAAPGNIPGARFVPATWTDTAGNFWLFGGFGYGSAGNTGDLNDLWKYEP